MTYEKYFLLNSVFYVPIIVARYVKKNQKSTQKSVFKFVEYLFRGKKIKWNHTWCLEIRFTNDACMFLICAISFAFIEISDAVYFSMRFVGVSESLTKNWRCFMFCTMHETILKLYVAVLGVQFVRRWCLSCAFQAQIRRRTRYAIVFNKIAWSFANASESVRPL